MYCLSYPCVLFVVSLCLVCRIPVSCLSYPCAWFVVSLCLVCPMLSVSLCCLFWVPHRFSRTFILNLWGSSQPIFSHGFDIIFHTFVFNRARVQNKQLFSCIMTMMRLIMMLGFYSNSLLNLQYISTRTYFFTFVIRSQPTLAVTL